MRSRPRNKYSKGKYAALVMVRLQQQWLENWNKDPGNRCEAEKGVLFCYRERGHKGYHVDPYLAAHIKSSWEKRSGDPSWPCGYIWK